MNTLKFVTKSGIIDDHNIMGIYGEVIRRANLMQIAINSLTTRLVHLHGS
jgi:hypothetical protein